MPIDGDKPWQIRLFGSFELKDPNGRSINLANRKVEGLLAVLAVNRDGVSRADLAGILWPTAPLSNRQDNLRQTLARAKKGIGAENLELSRTHCRLSRSFIFDCDFHDPSLRGDDAFLPEFEGEWFQSIRSSCESTFCNQSVLQSFSHLLSWLAEHDADQMLGLMRENHGLTFGLDFPHRARLLNHVQSDRSCPGWKLFLSSVVLGKNSDIVTATPKFLQCIEIAKTTGDTLLAIQASSQAALFLAWQNRFEEALAAIDWCCSIAAASSNKEFWATSTQMKGNILIHSGQFDAGLALLERAEQLYKATFDSEMMRALRCNYLAYSGRTKEASTLLESIKPGVRAPGHTFVDLIADLAQNEIEAYEKGSATTIEELCKIARRARVYQNEPLTLIIEEQLASKYLKVGDVPSAKSWAASARARRQDLRIQHSEWDRIRLSA